MPVSKNIRLNLPPKQAHAACRDALNQTYMLAAWYVEDETYYDIVGQGRYRALDIMFDFSITFKILKNGVVSLKLKADTSNPVPLEKLAESILVYEEQFLQGLEEKTPEEKAAIRRSAYDAVVFVSYARAKYEFADRVRRDLYLFDLEVWLDQDYLRTGEQWPVAIESAIEKADAFVLLISTEALASEWVRKELAHAKKVKTPIFPVVYEEASIPDWFKRQFGKLETADLGGKRYNPGLHELIDAIKQKGRTNGPN